jgi:DNA-directed RNA polymerase III subunit RPC8
VFDLVEVGEGKVRHGDGCLWYKRAWLSSRFSSPEHEFVSIVTFRMVVFRPFVSEVVLAKVKSSDEDGIRRMFTVSPHPARPKLILVPIVSVGFFDDMYIPLIYLPEPSAL